MPNGILPEDPFRDSSRSPHRRKYPRLRFIILYPAGKYIPGTSIFAWRHRGEQPRSPEMLLRGKRQRETTPLTFFFLGNIAGIIRRAFARALDLWNWRNKKKERQRHIFEIFFRYEFSVDMSHCQIFLRLLAFIIIKIIDVQFFFGTFMNARLLSFISANFYIYDIYCNVLIQVTIDNQESKSIDGRLFCKNFHNAFLARNVCYGTECKAMETW